jgi:hypothetical protein
MSIRVIKTIFNGWVVSALVLFGSSAFAGSEMDPGSWAANIPSPPSPPSFSEVNEGREIADSQHDTLGFIRMREVGNANGFTVIDNYTGEAYVVDDMKEPTCAVYATYVEKSDDHVEVNPLDEGVVSNVYIEEVNFENCQ